MSTDATDGSPDAEPAIDRATDLAADLGETVADLPVYERFLDARAVVEDSPEAQEKITEFEQLREEFMLARQAGDATNEALRELQRAQEELHEIPAMSDYLQAQSELELTLQELNETISEPLSVDFGEKAGGCCQD
jgi:cell fate (sporulation/competence/biofilm development) regulator YlbF (YheA/YmcA/DUF963 family)